MKQILNYLSAILDIYFYRSCNLITCLLHSAFPIPFLTGNGGENTTLSFYDLMDWLGTPLTVCLGLPWISLAGLPLIECQCSGFLLQSYFHLGNQIRIQRYQDNWKHGLNDELPIETLFNQ